MPASAGVDASSVEEASAFASAAVASVVAAEAARTPAGAAGPCSSCRRRRHLHVAAEAASSWALHLRRKRQAGEDPRTPTCPGPAAATWEGPCSSPGGKRRRKRSACCHAGMMTCRPAGGRTCCCPATGKRRSSCSGICHLSGEKRRRTRGRKNSSVFP